MSISVFRSCKITGRSAWLALSLFALAACGREEVVVVPIENASDELVLTPSPDVNNAKWSTAANGRTIEFGIAGEDPLLSLECQLETDLLPARIKVVRHARSQPGAKALFAVLGNGIATRLNLDASMVGSEGWLWQGTFPAEAGDFDVFTGPRGIEATLPGAGTLRLPASSIPRQFVRWCRRNGAET